MPGGSYSKKIEKAQVMLAGITSHKDILEPRGINDAYVEKFKNILQQCIDTNNTQEKAKADLITMTETLNEGIKELEKEYQICKRIVISDIDRSLWKEFGVTFAAGRRKTTPENNEENNYEKKPSS